MSMVALVSHDSGLACIFDNSSFIWGAWADDAYLWFSLLSDVFILRVGMWWGSITDYARDCALYCRLQRFGVSSISYCGMIAGEGRLNPSVGVFWISDGSSFGISAGSWIGRLFLIGVGTLTGSNVLYLVVPLLLLHKIRAWSLVIASSPSDGE